MAFFFVACASLCSSAGCSEDACFQWTENEGVCPAQDEALAFFEEPTCHFSDIKTVDSEGVFDDNACCYAVTKWGNDEPRAFECNGVGNAAVAVGVTSGGIGGSGPGSVSGVGGAGGIGGSGGQGGGTQVCIGCAEAISGGDPMSLCPESVAIYDAFQACACDGPCKSACGDTYCAQMDASQECLMCSQDPSAGCGEPFIACANDVP